jgi:hypothetical protein
MYFNSFGGSTLLHVLAAHPRVVATLGIAGTVAMLTTSLGRTDYVGANRYANALDEAIASYSQVDDAQIENAYTISVQLQATRSPRMRAAVRDALHACGRGCAELTPAIVENDHSLLKKALLVAELDRVASEHGRARVAANSPLSR